MKRFKVCRVFILVAPFYLTGCSSLSMLNTTCHGMTSEEIGRMDGATGNPRTRVSEREKECLSTGNYFNRQAYHDGEKEAIEQYYCSPLHAVSIGEIGGTYTGVCDRKKQERFLYYMRLGQRISFLRHAIRAIQEENSAIQEDIASHYSAPPVKYKRAKINNLGVTNQAVTQAIDQVSRPERDQGNQSLAHPAIPPMVLKRLNELDYQRKQAIVELASLEERVALLKKQEEKLNKPLPYGVSIINHRTQLNAITSPSENPHSHTYPSSLSPNQPLDDSNLSHGHISRSVSGGTFNTFSGYPDSTVSDRSLRSQDIAPPPQAPYLPVEGSHPSRSPVSVNSFPTTLDRMPGDNPGYVQSTVVYDASEPYPEQKNKIDPSDPAFAAGEYEQTVQQDINRNGQQFTLPKNNVIKNGTTIFINKDWYPR